MRRLVIVYDGHAWHVRRLKSIAHDLDTDEKVYWCDLPISNDLPLLSQAADAAALYLKRAIRRRR